MVTLALLGYLRLGYKRKRVDQSNEIPHEIPQTNWCWLENRRIQPTSIFSRAINHPVLAIFLLVKLLHSSPSTDRLDEAFYAMNFAKRHKGEKKWGESCYDDCVWNA
jgi:hypothetical protein